MYDFDTVYSRGAAGSEKWLAAQNAGCPAGVVPLTVADMEFAMALPIVQAVQAAAAGGIWGYTVPTESCKTAVINWMQRRHSWQANPEWMVNTAGVVQAIFVAVRAFTKPGDGVIIQPPVYPPFAMAPRQNDRKIIENPLLFENGQYNIDFDGLRRLAPQAKLMLLCSPHNPVGRVYTPDEIRQIAEICHQNGVVLFSDEIHCDILSPGQKHTSAGTLPQELLNNCVIATSAAKSFNLAGMPCSSIFVPNEQLRHTFVQQQGIDGNHFNSYFGTQAAMAAYNSCEGWLDEMCEYVWQNYVFVRDFLANHLPVITLADMQATYLAWIDFSAFGLADAQLNDFLRQKAAVYLNPGVSFGSGGEGRMRMNLAAPRSVLQAAMQRLADAAKKEGLI